jgi:DNA-binding response OmpR family regulator
MNDTSINVLLIEDDSGDAYLLQALLSSTKPVSFHLVCADRLATGLDHLSRNDFDIILLDLSLPDSRGLSTIDKVRLHAPDVPIVVLTGLDNEDTAMQAVQAGAQDYLSKDHLDHNMLTRSIRYAVERHRLQLALDQARLQEENSLKQANDELENRVEARTAELQRANTHLQAEIAERRKAENEREALVTHLMAANGALEELTEKVQQSHHENEQLIAAISSILIGVEADDRVSQWNTEAEMTFGLSSSDVLGRLLSECGLPWNQTTILAGVKRCRQSQQAVQLDHVHFTRDDKEKMAGLRRKYRSAPSVAATESSAQPLDSSSGSPVPSVRQPTSAEVSPQAHPSETEESFVEWRSWIALAVVVLGIVGGVIWKLSRR